MSSDADSSSSNDNANSNNDNANSNNSNSNVSDLTKILDETDVKTWITTDAVTDSFVQNGFRVTWIDWDSDFRNTDLQIEDVVTGYDDVSFEQFLEPGKHGSAIGQHGETTYWQKLTLKHGHTITLKVFRQGIEESLEISGKLLARRYYSDNIADSKRSLGPGGPPDMSRDGFSFAWSAWYEKIVSKMSSILDGGWDHKSIDNKRELQEHEGQKERIDYLQEKYPGPFADIILADWQKVRDSLIGKEIDTNDVDLEYREIGAKRVQAVKQEAQVAWNNTLSDLKEQKMISAFPTVGLKDRDQVKDKLVELPWISTRNFINFLGQSYAVIGNRTEGYYFVHLSNVASVRNLYDAIHRYELQVTPDLTERYQYIARITGEPARIAYDSKAVTGLMVEIVAARAGRDGEFFVNLEEENTEKDREVKFAGQEKINQFPSLDIEDDDASPAKVTETMIEAVKLGHEKAWKALFATWKAYRYWKNHIAFDPSYTPKSMFPNAWKRSRRLILDQVYDVRVDKTGTIRRILQKDDEIGYPDIDEVDVFVDHYELADNGKYRTFLDANVRRKWTLQRLDGGPWRITTVQVI